LLKKRKKKREEKKGKKERKINKQPSPPLQRSSVPNKERYVISEEQI
jgi:hypothetical protein